MMITPQQRRRRGVRGYQRVRRHRSLPRRTPLTTGDASNKARRECVPLRTTPPKGPAPGSSTAGSTSRSPFHLRLTIHRRAPLSPALNVRSWGSARGRLSVGSANPVLAASLADETFQPIRGPQEAREIAIAGFVREKKVKKTFFVSSAYGQCPSSGANFFLHFGDDNWHPDCSTVPRVDVSSKNIAAVF